MRIEHVAFDVADPAAVADWYVRHLGMKIVRKGPPPVSGHFLVPAEGASSMIEFYNNSKITPPDWGRIDDAALHLAFVSADVHGDRARLIAAGATASAEITHGGDDLIATLRDPWGLAIQLAQRRPPMI